MISSGCGGEQIVGRERNHVVFRSQDLDDWFVDARRVNSDVRPLTWCYGT